MTIEVTDNMTIETLRKLFSDRYPFLTIEFYAAPHRWQEESSFEHLLSHHKTIGEIRTIHHPGALEIHSWQKTGAVEQAFSKKLGLNMQVFRHQGGHWVQTAGTDALTLEEQNEIGKKATIDYKTIGGDSITQSYNLY